MSERDEDLQLSLFGQFEALAQAQDHIEVHEREQSLLKQDAALFQGQSSAGGMPVFLHPKANRYIYLNQCCIGYELQYKRRRSLGLYVSEQGVSVNVPRWVGKQEIERFLHEKTSWILRKLKEQKDKHVQQNALRIRWEDGGQIHYLGETVTLCVHEGGTDVELVDRAEDGQWLYVGVKHRPDMGHEHIGQKVRESVEHWMKQKALEFFNDRSAYFSEILKVCPQRIALTSAATRWGSASAQGVIRLHWRLMEMSVTLIDYVVVHELAHLREMNHSQKFWSLVEQVLPDYKDRRHSLKKVLLPIW